MFSIICMEFFGLEPAQAGYLLSFFGLLLMVSAGHTGPVRWAGESDVSRVSAALMPCYSLASRASLGPPGSVP